MQRLQMKALKPVRPSDLRALRDLRFHFKRLWRQQLLRENCGRGKRSAIEQKLGSMFLDLQQTASYRMFTESCM
jgi:hypothetical protein